jgi:hypothetical protein
MLSPDQQFVMSYGSALATGIKMQNPKTEISVVLKKVVIQLLDLIMDIIMTSFSICGG